MLTEYRNVRQESPSLRRRWFEGGDLELIVWQNLRGELTGFQLCHNQAGGPHALTWTPKDGFTHSCVDEGDSSPLRNETPILQPGGTVPWARLAEKFAAESGTIEPALRDAVANRLYTQG